MSERNITIRNSTIRFVSKRMQAEKKTSLSLCVAQSRDEVNPINVELWLERITIRGPVCNVHVLRKSTLRSENRLRLVRTYCLRSLEGHINIRTRTSFLEESELEHTHYVNLAAMLTWLTKKRED